MSKLDWDRQRRDDIAAAQGTVPLWVGMDPPEWQPERTVRQQFEALAREFGTLPSAKRVEDAELFRERLSAIVPDTVHARLVWLGYFEYLLPFKLEGAAQLEIVRDAVKVSWRPGGDVAEWTVELIGRGGKVLRTKTLTGTSVSCTLPFGLKERSHVPLAARIAGTQPDGSIICEYTASQEKPDP